LFLKDIHELYFRQFIENKGFAGISHGIYEVADLIENNGETCKRSIAKKLRPTFSSGD
jgi:hypothetical protein